ncbi:DinB superfamily protein [Chitinophaga sp. CF118]|uniref:DinB family protein n=1 Tax=Chitinophaga sp. CF118 TaxID=1884367 RepID=UPI0008E4741F|nr:DinB family protein [Chitinophaga sp. CF118]SFD17357.1 DinB superfamily protein [Chitinophaga sp. CF118]
MTKTFRQGAVGALLDEYERAISDLKKVIEDIPDNALTIIADPQTDNEDCRSVQTVLSHVVHSGYGYATRIHNLRGNNLERPVKTFRLTIREYLDDLTNVFSYTENTFSGITDNELEQFDDALKMRAWGQVYDIEQMMEHAIVHILRHRRQVEKFKLLII